MNLLLRTANALDRFARSTGEWASWLILPLIFIIMFDVITRKIDFIKEKSAEITIEYGYSLSFIFQDLEWHIHGVLLLLTFGYGYLRNAHVRVDIFREMASRRGQVKIEVLGLIICAIPFLLVMIYYSWIMTYASYTQGEGSESQVGIGMRFIIKSFLIIGFSVALAAVIAVLLRCFVYLRGDELDRREVSSELLFLGGHEEPLVMSIEPGQDTDSVGKD